MRNGEMYKRSYDGPVLRCVNSQEAREIMTKIHEGYVLGTSRVGHFVDEFYCLVTIGPI